MRFLFRRPVELTSSFLSDLCTSGSLWHQHPYAFGGIIVAPPRSPCREGDRCGHWGLVPWGSHLDQRNGGAAGKGLLFFSVFHAVHLPRVALFSDLAKLFEELFPLWQSVGALFSSILAIAWRLWLVLLPNLAELFEELFAVTRGFFGLACFLGQVTLPRDFGALQGICPGAQLA